MIWIGGNRVERMIMTTCQETVRQEAAIMLLGLELELFFHNTGTRATMIHTFGARLRDRHVRLNAPNELK